MKTKELIRRLQEIDPSGEIECCVGNRDIYYLSKDPAYYDGALQVLIRDTSRTDYNIIGAEFHRGGYKIQIQELSIEDAIHNAEDFGHELPIKIIPEYSEDSPYYSTNKRILDRIKKWRDEAKQITKEVDEWWKNKCSTEDSTNKFFKSPDHKL